MYFNVISFKNGKTLQFQMETPYSVDKLKEPDPMDQYGDWNLVTDATNGQTLSFRGAEVVTIASVEVKENREVRRGRYQGKQNKNRKPGVQIGRATE